MPLYKIDVDMSVFVEADDKLSARQTVDAKWKEMAGDVTPSEIIISVAQIRTLKEFKENSNGWDEKCFPYTLKPRTQYKERNIKDMLDE